MSDLISRSAAIDAMCDACETVQARCAHYPCKRYFAVQGIPFAQPELIEKTAYIRGFGQGRTQGMIDAEAKTQWIPVSERHPNNENGETRVLATIRRKYYKDCLATGVLEYNAFRCNWQVDGDDIDGWLSDYFNSFYEVVAWMPLPDPWKGEIDSENNNQI